MDPMTMMMASGPNGPDPMMMMMASKKANDALANAQSALKKFDAQTTDLAAQKDARVAELNEELSSLQQSQSALSSQINKLSADSQTLTAAVNQAYDDARTYTQQYFASLMNGGGNSRANAFQGGQSQQRNPQQRPAGLAQAMPEIRQPLGRSSK
jgi:chromosome segregation ATPase